MALGPGGACPGGYSRSADAALLRALRFVRDYGLVLVEGVPSPGGAGPGGGATMAEGEAASEALWRRMGSGRLQGSVYSAGAWRTEVLPAGDASHTDSAYGLRALASHTDGNYMDARPGLQAFHCLRADASGGGDTVLVDGFSVAERLRASDPAAFALLCAAELPYHHTGADGLQTQWKRVFDLDDGGRVVGFGFNDADRAPLTLRQYAGVRAVAAIVGGSLPTSASAPPALSLPSAVPEIYRALRALAACVRDPAAEVTLSLRPGTALVFDNRRVTHARTALGRATGIGRVLAGGYIAAEDWHSALRLVSRAAGAYEPA